MSWFYSTCDQRLLSRTMPTRRVVHQGRHESVRTQFHYFRYFRFWVPKRIEAFPSAMLVPRVGRLIPRIDTKISFLWKQQACFSNGLLKHVTAELHVLGYTHKEVGLHQGSSRVFGANGFRAGDFGATLQAVQHGLASQRLWAGTGVYECKAPWDLVHWVR